MLDVRVIPLLLYRGEGLYKGIGFRDHKYVGDARNAVRIFNAREAHEVVLLDIGATAEGRCISPELVRSVSQECLMPLAAGGGIGSADEARALVSAGAEKIVLNTAAIANPALVGEIADILGSQAVMVAIDAAAGKGGNYRVYSHNGSKQAALDPVAMAKAMEAAGAGEILLTSIDRDGTREGYDVALIRQVASAIGIPVIAGGGAGRLKHLAEAVYEGGAAAAAAGSLFVFHGRRRAVLISFPEREKLDAVFTES